MLLSFCPPKRRRPCVTFIPLSGKDQVVKLSLPRASSLNEHVDHSALLKLGAVSERVNRFDAKPSGEGVGFSKLQETRRIFEQRTLQVRRSFSLFDACTRFRFKTFLTVRSRRNKPPPTGSCWRRSARRASRTAVWTLWLTSTARQRLWTGSMRPRPGCACLAQLALPQIRRALQRLSAPRSVSSVLFLRRANLRAVSTSLSDGPPPPSHPNQNPQPERTKVGKRSITFMVDFRKASFQKNADVLILLCLHRVGKVLSGWGRPPAGHEE